MMTWQRRTDFSFDGVDITNGHQIISVLCPIGKSNSKYSLSREAMQERISIVDSVLTSMERAYNINNDKENNGSFT